VTGGEPPCQKCGFLSPRGIKPPFKYSPLVSNQCRNCVTLSMMSSLFPLGNASNSRSKNLHFRADLKRSMACRTQGTHSPMKFVFHYRFSIFDKFPKVWANSFSKPKIRHVPGITILALGQTRQLSPQRSLFPANTAANHSLYCWFC